MTISSISDPLLKAATIWSSAAKWEHQGLPISKALSSLRSASDSPPPSLNSLEILTSKALAERPLKHPTIARRIMTLRNSDNYLASTSKPTPALVAAEYPSIYLQYGRVMEWIDLIYPVNVPVDGEYRQHQQHLATILEQPPSDRKIYFVVDTVGNTGKSWFIKKWMQTHLAETQMLSIGKRDDLAHTVDPSKRFFLFDLPRSGSEYLQYTILEQLKDRFIFSPKYHSRTKVLEHLPHVVVFMNEHPDMTKLSADRYEIINWLNL